MDIGKLKNNFSFYDGYEGEGEVILSLVHASDYSLHIWDGYFEDIFGNPCSTEDGWYGFTMDYQESRNAFSGSSSPVSVHPNEYLNDLYQYRGKTFSYEESTSCLELLIAFFEYAKMLLSEVNVIYS